MNEAEKKQPKTAKELRDEFFASKITKPQTMEEIKKQNKIGVIKVASEGLVQKLLERCSQYREVLRKKNELIGDLTARLIKYEPELMAEIAGVSKLDLDPKKDEELKEAANKEKDKEKTKEKDSSNIKPSESEKESKK